MKAWPRQDAKARFSELLDLCLKEGPQLITRRGKDAAVLVPIDDWARLQPLLRPSRKQVLVEEGPKVELPLPPRGRLRRRAPPTSMTYLLDTNVVSELRRVRPQRRT